jgi:hypothetical protein
VWRRGHQNPRPVSQLNDEERMLFSTREFRTGRVHHPYEVVPDDRGFL